MQSILHYEIEQILLTFIRLWTYLIELEGSNKLSSIVEKAQVDYLHYHYPPFKSGFIIGSSALSSHHLIEQCWSFAILRNLYADTLWCRITRRGEIKINGVVIYWFMNLWINKLIRGGGECGQFKEIFEEHSFVSSFPYLPMAYFSLFVILRDFKITSNIYKNKDLQRFECF